MILKSYDISIFKNIFSLFIVNSEKMYFMLERKKNVFVKIKIKPFNGFLNNYKTCEMIQKVSFMSSK